MATATGSFVVRLGVRDADVVRRALEGLGNDGERALRRLDRAARVPAAGFNVLKAATGEVNDALAGLAQRSGSTGNVLAALGSKGTVAAAAIGAAVIGIGAAMARSRQALESLDRLDDTAVKLGVTAEGLQALRFAFGQTGAEADAVDAALEKLGQSIGQMASEGEDAPEALRSAFSRLGVEVRDAEGHVKSAEVVLAEMAAGMVGVQSQAERIDLARALMGRGGAALLPLLQQGEAALAAMKTQARDLGVVIDEHLVKYAGEAADRLDTMQLVINANLNQAFLDLAPLLVGAAEGFAWLARQAAAAADSFRDLEARSTRGLEARLAELRDQRTRLEQGRIVARLIGPAWTMDEVDAEIAKVEAVLNARTALREEERGPAAATVAAAGTGTATGTRSRTRKPDPAAKAAREADALARDRAADAKVIADLGRQLATYGDLRRQAVDQALSRASERATAAERAEVERLAGALWDQAEASRAAAALGREQAQVAREAAEAARAQAEAEAERRDWAGGLRRGLRDYADEATNASKIAEDAVAGGFDAMEEALLAFTATGKLEWAAMIDMMVAELTRLSIRMAIMAPLARAAESVNWAAVFGGGNAGTGIDATAGVTAAKGAAFDHGRVLAAYARGGTSMSRRCFPWPGAMA
jgi:lambda family phage tail tape measure protein